VLEFNLSGPLNPGFVCAIVSKLHMGIRKERFDLTYFTKSAANPLLPPTAVLMAESADVTDLVFKSSPGAALLSQLGDPVVSTYFRSLVITDQPDKRPDRGPVPTENKRSRIILSLNLPSENVTVATESLIRVVFELIDFLDGKLTVRDDISRKLVKTRAELDAQLTKEATAPSAEEKEEAEEAKRAAKKKAEEEWFATLTPEQQKRHEEKERKRSLQKAHKKMITRP